jgi:hypothetical protein
MNFLSVDQYAKKMHWGVDKVYRYIEQGLPAINDGERGRKVVVELADAWVIDRFRINQNKEDLNKPDDF